MRWPSLLGLVLSTACGAGTPDTAPGDAVAGVRSTPGAAGETGARDPWQAVRMDQMAGDRSSPEPEGRNPFRFGAPRSATQSGPSGGDPPGPEEAPVLRGVSSDLDPVPAAAGRRVRPVGQVTCR